MTTIRNGILYDDTPVKETSGLKLNLGCGNDKRVGYVNIDASPLVKPNFVINFEDKNCLEFFRDNSVSEIIIYHVLEHIHNFIPLMKEIHRVCKPGAIIDIRCPFYASWGQWNDPTHVRFFSLYTFNYFKPHNYSHECGIAQDGKAMFDYEVSLNYAIGRMKFMNWLMNPLINLWKDFYVRFLAFIIPCSEIKYKLTIIKEEKK